MAVLNAETNAGFLIHDVSRMMRGWFDERAQDLGVTRAQWRVLVHLAAREGVNQRELAEILELDTVTLGRHIDRLERDKWLERRPDPKDRRAWLLHLLPAARPILDQMETLAERTMALALDGLSTEERAQFIDVLTRIKGNMTRDAAASYERTRDAG
ncbi:MAG: MarR family winged helix-turn-helix transcriptional regulator [Paracoccaceae bacterium]